MKKFILAAVLLGSLSLHAQKPKENPAGLSSFAAVKWNPGSLFLGKLSLAGEYNIKAKRSLTIGIGIPMEKTMSFDIDKESRDVTLKTSSAMLGYRMYLGKKTMSGFYFEPYAKYVKNDGSTVLKDVVVESSTSTKTDFLLTSKYSGVGVGAQLGLQFTIAKVIVLDLFILGPEANSAKHDVVVKDLGTAIPWSMVEAEAKQELEDIVRDVPIIGKKIKIETDANTRSAYSSYKGFLPGFRSGISVGIRF